MNSVHLLARHLSMACIGGRCSIACGIKRCSILNKCFVASKKVIRISLRIETGSGCNTMRDSHGCDCCAAVAAAAAAVDHQYLSWCGANTWLLVVAPQPAPCARAASESCGS